MLFPPKYLLVCSKAGAVGSLPEGYFLALLGSIEQLLSWTQVPQVLVLQLPAAFPAATEQPWLQHRLGKESKSCQCCGFFLFQIFLGKKKTNKSSAGFLELRIEIFSKNTS